MAIHDIEIELPPKVVLHKDVTFVVRSDNEKLGELRISKGSVDWVPRSGRIVRRLPWERFDALMQEHGLRR